MDQHYNQIIKRLSGTLDSTEFERCMCDLLRAVYPDLTPMPGGSDMGMDGLIGDHGFLVATAGKEVLRNLDKNLRSHLSSQGTRRNVVLATSQVLSAKRVRNLENCATELGFRLKGVHQQEDIANRLYHDSKWCKAFLKLTGEPPALSIIPLTERALLSGPLIGREPDLAWLRQSTGDRLLVGQPGSGKTFLLHKLAMEGNGLFARSDDHAAIANAMRDQQPSTIIVDDAQVHTNLVVALKQMRQEIGAEFSILASCWPGEKSNLAYALNVPESRIRQLDLLTRDEIVEVVKSAGLQGPNELIREIVNQAEGQPGLAVTLAYLCLQGDVRKVALGDAISGSLLKFFEPLVGQQASAILAAFSVGGDSGLPMNAVAHALSLNLLDVRSTVVKLAAGGVILDLPQNRLSVRPTALRHALVRDVFFKGATSLPVELLISQASNQVEVAYTLIGANARGANIPQDLLIGILERAGAERTWAEYALLGRDESVWLCEHHPELVVAAARPLLYRAAEVALPILLKKAVGDNRRLHSATDHPLRIISDWIEGARRGTGEVLWRRKLLLNSVREWLSNHENTEVGLRALAFVMSPKFETNDSDPGSGNSVTLYFGYILLDEMQALQNLWSHVLELIQASEIRDWEPICNIVEMWAYPGRVADVSLSKEMVEMMQSLAGQMIRDLIALKQSHMGIRLWAKRVVAHAKLDIEVMLSPDFETLYPVREFQDRKAAEAKQALVVQQLAVKWSVASPEEIAKRLAQIERDARLAHITWPRWTPKLCSEIAEEVSIPTDWLLAMIEVESSADMVLPFLRKVVEKGETEWENHVCTCLAKPLLKGAAISIVLTMQEPPEELLSQVWINLGGYESLVDTLCVRQEIPEHIVNRLLCHPNEKIVSAAAEGEWYAEPASSVRASLQANWRNAVINAVDDAHLLEEMLRNDTELAYAWLQKHLIKQRGVFYERDGAFVAAVSALDKEARRKVLLQIPEFLDMFGVEKLIIGLIGNDVELYQDFLADEHFKEFHLVPLSGHPEGIWIEKAKLALDAGYSVKEVSQAVYVQFSVMSRIGNESSMWAEWVERFEKLCLHEDEQIREVGNVGKAKAQASQERAMKEERREAVYGLGY